MEFAHFILCSKQLYDCLKEIPSLDNKPCNLACDQNLYDGLMEIPHLIINYVIERTLRLNCHAKRHKVANGNWKWTIAE
jgi:hypothetical protein